MEHIEREAKIGSILLSKSEDIAKRVKVLNKADSRVNRDKDDSFSDKGITEQRISAKKSS